MKPDQFTQRFAQRFTQRFTKILQPTLVLGVAIALSVVTLPIAALPSAAQDAPGSRQRGGASQIKFDPPVLPNVDAPSGRQRGGASRTGNCPEVAQPLTALVPAQNDSVIGLTTAAQPTLWFYVPYVLNADHPAEFVLLDEGNRYVYRTTLANASTESTGIVQISLPETVTLEPDKLYRWAFTVNCGIDSSVFTIGGIQRVTIDSPLSMQIEQATGLDQVSLYAQNGIWFDALTGLANLKQENPTDAAIATEWENLLRSVGLEEVTNQPFVP
jgi:hypothetical protein